MAKRIISINSQDICIIRTNIPVQQRIVGMPFARKPCMHRKYIKAQINGHTIGTLFVSIKEAAKTIKSLY
jgi:hypothetical protein